GGSTPRSPGQPNPRPLKRGVADHARRKAGESGVRRRRIVDCVAGMHRERHTPMLVLAPNVSSVTIRLVPRRIIANRRERPCGGESGIKLFIPEALTTCHRRQKSLPLGHFY